MENKEASRTPENGRVLDGDAYVTTLWSGGKTTQLAIAPPDGDYAGRDFLWRVSSAVVETEESDFTPLPDYVRYIAVLRGGVTLRHNGGAPVVLLPFAVHRFDGGDETRSAGRCVDFNLMLRKGKTEGAMTALTCPGEPAFLEADDGEDLLLYAFGGECVLRFPRETVRLFHGQTFLKRDARGLRLEASVPPGGALMVCRMKTV